MPESKIETLALIGGTPCLDFTNTVDAHAGVHGGSAYGARPGCRSPSVVLRFFADRR